MYDALRFGYTYGGDEMINLTALRAMILHAEEQQEKHVGNITKHSYWCGMEDALLVIEKILTTGVHNEI